MLAGERETVTIVSSVVLAAILVASESEFNLNRYFGTADPQLAAERMIRDVKAAGGDVDYRPTGGPWGLVLAIGEWMPPEGNPEFLKSLQGVNPDSTFVVIAQHGGLSYKDYAEMLRGGINILHLVYWPRGAFAAELTAYEALQLAQHERVRWIGPIPPEWKYNPESFEAFKSNQHMVLVGSHFSARPEFEEDLRSLGVRVQTYTDNEHWCKGVYSIDSANEAKVAEIAELEWVWQIRVYSTELRNTR